MRLGFAPIEDDDGNFVNGDAIISKATQYRMGKGLPNWDKFPRGRLCNLSIREQGAKAPVDNNAFIIFSINPKAINITQNARVSVQQGRNGYVISEAGLAEPRITIQGSFGHMLRRVPVPSDFYSNDNSNSALVSKEQYLDGQQTWFKLAELIKRYFNANQRRAQEGKKQLELVWFDPLHGADNTSAFRWVVVPTAVPSFSREVDTQGVIPYRLELICHYDDVKGIRANDSSSAKGIKLTSRPNPKFDVAGAPSAEEASNYFVDFSAPPVIIDGQVVGELKPLTSFLPNSVPTAPLPSLPKPPTVDRPNTQVYDFRKSPYAVNEAYKLFTKLGYPLEKHVQYGGNADTYKRGALSFLSTLPFLKIYKTPETIAGDNGITSTSLNLVNIPQTSPQRSQLSISLKGEEAIIKVRLGVYKTPWNTKRGTGPSLL